MNDLTFFTNEPERDLYSRFCSILKSNTQFFDILVGYFRTSGFFKLYKAMEDVEKIRILVGIDVDKTTVDLIEKSQQDIYSYSSMTVNKKKEIFAKEIEDEFNEEEVSAEIEEGVNVFIDWLKNGKLEMRIYTQAPIHAKVYVMRKNTEKVPDNFGSVITGSSNFSLAGLKNNLEFNVELKDSRDVKFALEKFEDLWKESFPIEKDYINTVEQRTWLKNDITPYEIYLKTLYEFFIEEINADKEFLGDNLFPKGYMNLKYQLDAVVQAKKILETYNGVFISDVVGLGKTYICAMLAKILKKGRKLVICPPVLVDYWKEVFLEFDVSAKVESLGKLDKILQEGVDIYDYIFVDEAHRFRNDGTENYSKLHKICYSKKVVLISATPINNYSTDLENQITLFQSKHNSNIIGIKNLEKFFKDLRTKLNKYTKGTPAYLKQLRANSEEIRNKILRYIMIRRTRNDIARYYTDDLEKQGLKFPKLGTPEALVYVFDEDTSEVFNDTVNLIRNFKYARYKPLTYLKDVSKYSQLLVSQENMGGFMKTMLMKRLESSFFAFRNTLRRFTESYKKFIEMYETGKVYISNVVNVYDLLDSGDDEKILSLVEKEDVKVFNSDDFNPKFIKDLKTDFNRLTLFQSLWDGITSDPKLLQFKEELKTNKKLQSKKKIIFTESKETAQYLESELKDIFGDRVISFSGESSNVLKRTIEDSFNPKCQDKRDLYDVLITTDVLSEGINLHRANVLINYDLPWNPTKIMQRVGRINRVGSQYDEIFVFNFFPTDETTKHLPLKDRIIEKLQLFHDTLGEDFKYLSDEEEVTSQTLFQEMTKNLESEEDSNPELKYLAVIRKIRDNDPALYEKIKNLPKKSKTGRYTDKLNEDSTVTFVKKGALKSFFIANDKKELSANQISFLNAIDYLECEPNEEKINVGANYFKHLRANNLSFDHSFIQEDVTTTAKPKIESKNDQNIVKILRFFLNQNVFDEKQKETINKMITAFENGNIPAQDSKKISKELGKIDDLLKAYEKIVEMLDEKYLEDREQNVIKIEGKKEVVLSCYLKKQ